MVAAFIDSIAAIAAGSRRRRGEQGRKRPCTGLSLAISFLARFAGLGNVPKKVMEIIKKIRAPDRQGARRGRQVDRRDGAEARASFVAQAGVPQDPNERLRLASQHAVTLAKPLAGKATAPLLNAALNMLKTRYALTALEPFEHGGDWWVTIRINPVTKQKLVPGAKAGSGVTNLDQQAPLASLADRAAAISAMSAIGSKKALGITAISQLTDAKFAQYKSEYVSTYAPPKAVGANFQWPHFYLRTRAARRAGFDAEGEMEADRLPRLILGPPLTSCERTEQPSS